MSAINVTHRCAESDCGYFGQPSPKSCGCHKSEFAMVHSVAKGAVEALTSYRKAQRALRDDWAEGDINIRKQLWRNLHNCEQAADGVIAEAEGR